MCTWLLDFTCNHGQRACPRGSGLTDHNVSNTPVAQVGGYLMTRTGFSHLVQHSRAEWCWVSTFSQEVIEITS